MDYFMIAFIKYQPKNYIKCNENESRFKRVQRDSYNRPLILEHSL